MNPPALGTILPNPVSERKYAAAHSKQVKDWKRIALTTPELRDLKPVYRNGEERFYWNSKVYSTPFYAIISERDGKIRWFQVRDEHDYACPCPRFYDEPKSYEERVADLEAQGLTTSDAQGVIDAEDRQR